MSLADDDACGCPFCDGSDVPTEIIERIKAAAAGPMSKPMNLDEFRVWLDGVGRSPEVRQLVPSAALGDGRFRRRRAASWRSR